MSTHKIGDIVTAPLGTTTKRTKVRIVELQPPYARVEYVEKKIREELGNKPFLVQIKNLGKIDTVKVTTNSNRIIPDVWVQQNLKQFPNWINTVFLPYRVKSKENKKADGFEYRTFQKFIRDYLSLNSPYRGLLLYHGLGSGKTCSSIAVAESLKSSNNVLVISPASLRGNFIKALKTDCGVSYQNKNIADKFTFVSYNAPNTIDQLKSISTLDNHTIIIDEIHNLISMMVTQSKKGPEIYRMLMEAKNVKIVALSGTPIINFPFEIAILCNILRGFIEVPTFFIKESKKVGGTEWQTTVLKEKFMALPEVSYADSNERYMYVYLNLKSYDDGFNATIEKLIGIATGLGIRMDFIETAKYTLYPDDEEEFRSYFIEETESGDVLKNLELLKRRMLGLISYYRGGKPIYYPTVNPVNFIEVPMSDYQFQQYQEVREVEREKEKSAAMQKLLGKVGNSRTKDKSSKKVASLFRVFSRQYSNFVFPPAIERPFVKKFLRTAQIKMLEKKAKTSNKALANLEKMMEEENKRMEEGPIDPKDRTLIDKALQELDRRKDEYLKNNENGLKKYSPKMSKMIELMQTSPGLILGYSTFRSLEGIAILGLALEANGWARYDVDNPGKNAGKPKYAIYSGAEDEEERRKLIEVYNSDENKYGEKLKALLITSAGAEGLDLKNIRQVHILEPYWHDVRPSQVIGRANRFLSHIALPEKDRTVDVYRYISLFSPEQKELIPEKESTDQYIYEIAVKKLKVTEEIKQTLKEIAVDCTLNAEDNEKEIKCFSFGLDASGLAYKANIKDDYVYGKTEIGIKTVQKKLEPMFLDDENNLIWADKKKKQLCYFNNRECKEPLKTPPKKVKKVGVDMKTFEVFDIEGANKGNLIKLGVVDEKGKLV